MKVLAITGSVGSGQTEAMIVLASHAAKLTPGRVVTITPWETMCASLARCFGSAIPVLSVHVALDGLGVPEPHTVLVHDLDMVPEDRRERLLRVIRDAGTLNLITGSA